MWFSREQQDGTRGVYARGAAAGMARLDGMLEHLAHLLGQHCPALAGLSHEELLSEALVLLANPMAALKRTHIVTMQVDTFDLDVVLDEYVRAA